MSRLGSNGVGTLLFLAAVVFVTLFGFSTAQAPEADNLEGAHVCFCWKWTTGREWVNVTYPCWNIEKKTGDDCYDHDDDEDDTGSDWEVVHGHRRHRWKRSWGTDWWTDDEDYEDDEDEVVCYVHSLKTCSRKEWRCYGRWVKVEFCCNGYEEDGSGGCRRTTQCSRNNGGCEQMCKTTSSGHRCECLPGFKLVDGTRCVDINECTDGTAGCQYDCQNTNGSYYCKCPQGYEMTSATECKPINECLRGNGGCEHKCVDTEESYYCECEEGFDLKNGNECHDIDECEAHNGGCSDGCFNRYGGYRCTCPTGEILAGDGKTCIVGVESTTRFREPFESDLPSSPLPTGDLSSFPPPIGAEQKGSSLSGGTIAGIAIGTLLGLAALGCLFCLLCCLGRRLLLRRSAAAAPPAEHVYAQPVMPIPIKKKIPLDGTVVVTPGEKTAYTNLAYDNEVYGTVWDSNIIPATKPDPSPPEEPEEPEATVNPAADEIIYENVESKPERPPVPPKDHAYDNVLNELKKGREEGEVEKY